MRLFGTLVAVFLLFALLDACSTYRDFFGDGPPSAEADGSPVNPACARVAARRADDAVMALYVEEGSAGERRIYQATYQACVEWAAAH